MIMDLLIYCVNSQKRKEKYVLHVHGTRYREAKVTDSLLKWCLKYVVVSNWFLLLRFVLQGISHAWLLKVISVIVLNDGLFTS